MEIIIGTLISVPVWTAFRIGLWLVLAGIPVILGTLIFLILQKLGKAATNTFFYLVKGEYTNHLMLRIFFRRMDRL